jgi:hypothetical protein
MLAIVAGCRGAASTAPSAPPAPPSVNSQPSPSPAPAVSTTPNASPIAAPALTETFTSARHGLSVSYPADWTIRPAEAPWVSGFPSFDDTYTDVIYDPARGEAHLFLSLASQPLAGKTGDSWAAGILQELAGECGTGSLPVTIGGVPGVMTLPDCNVALTSAGDRGYLTWLYMSGDEGWLDQVYDVAWFKDILATVKLDPEAAVD